jgi:hypothetical protein
MRWRKTRTTPSVTELIRVEKILERDRAICRRLGRRTTLVRKRTGEKVWFASEVVAIAEAMMTRKLNPERASVRQVLSVAVRVLRGDTKKD